MDPNLVITPTNLKILYRLRNKKESFQLELLALERRKRLP